MVILVKWGGAIENCNEGYSKENEYYNWTQRYEVLLKIITEFRVDGNNAPGWQREKNVYPTLYGS